MRHHNKKRTLGRDKDQYTALMRGLAQSLILEDKIVTTTAKAKELRPFAEKLVTGAKENTLAAQRRIRARLGAPKTTVLEKLRNLGEKYKDRNGGYTRIVKLGRTKAGRDEAVIEFV